MNFSTAFSTNAVSIFNAVGLKKITRLEISTRYVIRFEDTPTTPETLAKIEGKVSAAFSRIKIFLWGWKFFSHLIRFLAQLTKIKSSYSKKKKVWSGCAQVVQQFVEFVCRVKWMYRNSWDVATAAE